MTEEHVSIKKARRGGLARPAVYRRNSLRLKNWNYFLPGPYFTICTDNRKEMFLSGPVRGLVIETFKNKAVETASTIHAIVVASNHVHGIVTLPDGEKISLSQFIGKAKVKTSQQLRGQASLPLRDAIWQRSFYDHVIRDEKDFLEKAHYIEKHPMKEEGNIYAEWH